MLKNFVFGRFCGGFGGGFGGLGRYFGVLEPSRERFSQQKSFSDAFNVSWERLKSVLELLKLNN